MKSLSVDQLLEELRRRRWTLYFFGDPKAPHLIAAMFQWEVCADVLILRGEEDATAYRVPTFREDDDVFLPGIVSWQYHSDPEWTLRAVLTIGVPGQADAPFALLRPDSLSKIPIELRRPVTIRPAGLVQRPTL
ncbi:hypothetical protein AB0N89_20310 [Amycolatopsis sp. NPDC089917]|uniref:hypothetical protein n=1 Tax=Amycolatopsis sp. NPDC089917 TaxID=3155187 RepID=UPI0034498CB2